MHYFEIVRSKFPTKLATPQFILKIPSTWPHIGGLLKQTADHTSAFVAQLE